jgi:hypothetical protein
MVIFNFVTLIITDLYHRHNIYLSVEIIIDNYFTRQYIPEDNSKLHTRRRENLKSHMTYKCSQ